MDATAAVARTRLDTEGAAGRPLDVFRCHRAVR